MRHRVSNIYMRALPKVTYSSHSLTDCPKSAKMGGLIQPIDLFFGLYILANIDDKTYKISNQKADLVQ